MYTHNTHNDAKTHLKKPIHTTVWKVALLCNLTLINSAIHHYPSLPCRPLSRHPYCLRWHMKASPSPSDLQGGRLRLSVTHHAPAIRSSGPCGGLRRYRRTKGSGERRYHPLTSARHNRERKLCTLKMQQNVLSVV